MITDLNQINADNDEGKMLLAAIAIITTESQTDKTPNKVIAQLMDLQGKMHFEEKEPELEDYAGDGF